MTLCHSLVKGCLTSELPGCNFPSVSQGLSRKGWSFFNSQEGFMAEKLFCCWCSYLRETAHLPLKQVHSTSSGRCATCNTYRSRFGFDRSLETIESEIERDQRKLLTSV